MFSMICIGLTFALIIRLALMPSVQLIIKVHLYAKKVYDNLLVWKINKRISTKTIGFFFILSHLKQLICVCGFFFKFPN